MKYLAIISAVSGLLLGFFMPIALGVYMKLKEGRFVTFLGLHVHDQGSGLERELSRIAVMCYRGSLVFGVIFLCTWFLNKL